MIIKNLELTRGIDKRRAYHIIQKLLVDIMYNFPHGIEELEGIANRTDFDLGSHTLKIKKILKLLQKLLQE